MLKSHVRMQEPENVRSLFMHMMSAAFGGNEGLCFVAISDTSYLKTEMGGIMNIKAGENCHWGNPY